MSTKHPDAPAIDRVGAPAIQQRFGITKQAVSYWRKAGVPKEYREKMIELGRENHCGMPEMRKMRDRVTT